MKKHQEHKDGLLGKLEKYLNNLYIEIFSMTRDFDSERKQKIIGFFCDILIENHCNVVNLEGNNVTWEFTSGNKHFKKLIGREIKSYDELDYKEKKEAEKLERKWGKRWKKKALQRYLMDVDGSSTEEKMALLNDVKAELKDKDDSELKNLVNKV